MTTDPMPELEDEIRLAARHLLLSITPIALLALVATFV